MGGLAAGGSAARSGAHAGSSLAAPSPRGRGTSGRRGPRSSARPWLPDVASHLRVHRRAPRAVERVCEGGQVLQRAQRPAGGRRGLRQRRPGRGAQGHGGHVPVLQGAVDVGLDGLDGELGPVGPTPHLWVHEGRGCGTWRRGGGMGYRGKEDQRGCWGGHRGPGEAGAPRAVARRECGLVPLWAQRSPARTPAAPSWVGGGKPAGCSSPSTATSESCPAPTPPPSFSSRKASWPTSSGSARLARQGVPGGMRQWGPAKDASGGAGFQPAGQGTDPHLCVADEEQLLVGQLQSWQPLVPAAFRHPL